MSLLAGCLAPADPSVTGGEAAVVDGGEGNFRLLISDLPADIGDFDELNVTFDEARVFPGDGTDDAGNGQDPQSQGEESEGDGGAGKQRGFFVLDLDETVDLTEVIGDKAISVFEGDLDPGWYNKVELSVAEVQGILANDEDPDNDDEGSDNNDEDPENGEGDDNLAEVKVPSEKLQIVRPFEVTADETLSFVFDINVVRRGPTNRYNLLPVISKSGVVGEHVDEPDELEIEEKSAEGEEEEEEPEEDEEENGEEEESDEEEGEENGDGEDNGDEEGEVNGEEEDNGDEEGDENDEEEENDDDEEDDEENDGDDGDNS